MSRQEVKIAFARLVPLVNDCPKFPSLTSNENCLNPGLCAELVQRIAIRFNLTIVPVVANTEIGDHEVGSYVNGTWTGMMGYVANGTADTACIFFNETPLRKQYFDFSTSAYEVEAAFAVGRRQDPIANGLFDLFNHFSIDMWVSMAAILLLTALIALLVAKAECLMGFQPTLARTEIAWQVLRLQLRQQPVLQFSSMAGRLVCFVFAAIQCLVLLSLYQGMILSALISRKHEAPFSNDQQLLAQLASGKARIVIRNTGNWFYETVMNSNDSHHAKLRESLSRHPVARVDTIEDVWELVEGGGNYVLPAAMDNLLTETAGRCDTVVVKSHLEPYSAHFVFPKGSKFVKMFDIGIEEERPEIRRLYRRYRELPYEMKRKACAKRPDRPMKMTPFLGVFIVCSVGLSIAIVAFIGEQASSCIVNKSREPITRRLNGLSRL